MPMENDPCQQILTFRDRVSRTQSPWEHSGRLVHFPFPEAITNKLNPSINGQVFIEHPLLRELLQTHIRAGLRERGWPANKCIFGHRKQGMWLTLKTLLWLKTWMGKSCHYFPRSSKPVAVCVLRTQSKPCAYTW